jgi:hypothetical protein
MRVRWHLLAWLGLLLAIGNDLLFRRVEKLNRIIQHFLPESTLFSLSSYPPCAVLLTSSGAHVELIESVIVQFDFSSLNDTARCDQSVFTFLVQFWSSNQQEPTRSWLQYARRELSMKETVSPVDGSRRTLILDSESSYFDYFLRTDCLDDMGDGIFAATRALVGSGDCSSFIRTMSWSKGPCLFPSYLPRIKYPDPPSPSMIHICLLQDPLDSVVPLLTHFLWNHPHVSPALVQFHHFANDTTYDPPHSTKHFRDRIQFHPRRHMEYMEYHRFLYETCDAIISTWEDVTNVIAHDMVKGLAVASAYHKPLLLHDRVEQVYRNWLPSSRVTTFQGDIDSFSARMNKLLNSLKKDSSNDRRWRPPCQVLLDNHHVAYHYFLLESMLAYYPLPQIDACNSSRFEFTIFIIKGINSFQRQRARSWKDYAERHILHRIYRNESSERELIDIIPVPSKGEKDGLFHYHINTTCRCDETTSWLTEKANAFCVFHEKCPQFESSQHAVWLSPMFGRYFFPNLLPSFNHKRNKTETVNLCVIGHPMRRNYDLVANYLSNHPHVSNETLRIHNIGWGPVPDVLGPYRHFVSFYAVAGFEEYQRLLYDTCDGILSLLTKSHHAYYFPDDEKKLIGIVCHASAYKMPILIHKELADLYSPYLGRIVETHQDDQISFGNALNRLLSRIKGR